MQKNRWNPKKRDEKIQETNPGQRQREGQLEFEPGERFQRHGK